MAIPAICKICEKRMIDAGGEFVQFRVLDPKEIEFNSDLSDNFGHPFGNKFFCDEHLGLALKYKHLTLDEAEPLIKRDFENGDIPKAPAKTGFLDKVFRLVSRD